MSFSFSVHKLTNNHHAVQVCVVSNGFALALICMATLAPARGHVRAKLPSVWISRVKMVKLFYKKIALVILPVRGQRTAFFGRCTKFGPRWAKKKFIIMMKSGNNNRLGHSSCRLNWGCRTDFRRKRNINSIQRTHSTERKSTARTNRPTMLLPWSGVGGTSIG